MHITAPQSLFRRQDGQTMAEYALVLAAVVLAVVGVVSLLSGAIVSRFGTVATTIKDMIP